MLRGALSGIGGHEYIAPVEALNITFGVSAGLMLHRLARKTLLWLVYIRSPCSSPGTANIACSSLELAR